MTTINSPGPVLRSPPVHVSVPPPSHRLFPPTRYGREAPYMNTGRMNDGTMYPGELIRNGQLSIVNVQLTVSQTCLACVVVLAIGIVIIDMVVLCR